MRILNKFLRGQLRRDIYFSLGGVFWLGVAKWVFKNDISFVKILYPFICLFSLYLIVTTIALLIFKFKK